MLLFVAVVIHSLLIHWLSVYGVFFAVIIFCINFFRSISYLDELPATPVTTVRHAPMVNACSKIHMPFLLS